MKRFLTLLVIGEMQMETKVLISAHLLEWLEKNQLKTTISSADDEDAGQLELSYTAGENAK